MRRLLRHLVAVLARALHALGDRLRPAPAEAGPTDHGADVAGDAGTALDGGAGGPPAHWLAMVARRAPGLHVSLQERGVVGRPVAGRDTTRVLVPVARTPASKRTRATGHDASPRTARAEAAAAVALARAETERLAVPSQRLDAVTMPAATPATAAGHPTVPAAASAGQVHSDADTIASRIASRRAAPAGGWPAEPTPSMPMAWSSATEPTLPARPEPPPRPLLRPLSLRAGSMPERTRPTPFFAPARDEDVIAAQIPRLPRPHHGADLERAACELPSDAALPCFPRLPDEPAPAKAAIHPFGWADAPAAHSNARAAAWPTRQAAWVRPAGGDERGRHDRDEGGHWPALHEESPGSGDPGHGAPDGHRARLEREQRGIPWNG